MNEDANRYNPYQAQGYIEINRVSKRLHVPQGSDQHHLLVLHVDKPTSLLRED